MCSVSRSILAKAKFAEYIEFYDYGVAEGRIETLTTADPKTTRPLQAADIFAYEMARAHRAGRPKRYPFQRIIDGCKSNNRKLIMGWDRLGLSASILALRPGLLTPETFLNALSRAIDSPRKNVQNLWLFRVFPSLVAVPVSSRRAGSRPLESG